MIILNNSINAFTWKRRVANIICINGGKIWLDFFLYTEYEESMTKVVMNEMNDYSAFYEVG